MRFNKAADLLFILIIMLTISILVAISGCSMFKPGTLGRVEEIAIEDELKMVADEVKEIEGDFERTTPNTN